MSKKEALESLNKVYINLFQRLILKQNMITTPDTVETTKPIIEQKSMKAEFLSAQDINHLHKAAEIMKAGGVVALPFNGIYGLFGDADNIQAASHIMEIKNRPEDKRLIVVSAPEHLNEHVDLKKLHYPINKLKTLWDELHALGIIFPASDQAPSHIVSQVGELPTIVSIWTEYKPLRLIMNRFRGLGGRAFVGTSANKSGMPTHNKTEELWEDFKNDLHAVMGDNFDQLPPIRRKSTSMIDLTGPRPIFHRDGNVEQHEIDAALKRCGLPTTIVKGNVIKVVQKD